MVDYPYQASFLGNLPAWPVNYSCQLLINETTQGIDILTAFKDFAGILYNDTSKCFDIYEQFIEVTIISIRSNQTLNILIIFIFKLKLKVCRSNELWFGQ